MPVGYYMPNNWMWSGVVTTSTTTTIQTGGTWYSTGSAIMNNWPTVTVATPEQLAAQREAALQERERQRRHEELLMAQYRARDEARQVATERARVLLFSILTDQQRSSYELLGYFHVVGSVSGDTYRVHRNDYQGNVVRLWDNGSPRTGYCAHPRRDEMPLEDLHLAQLLEIETNEGHFLEVANETQRWRRHDSAADRADLLLSA